MWWLVMYEYKSQMELYQGLIPAMNVKLEMLKRNNYTGISREDIWNYLRDYKWKSSVDLMLCDMVQDIIHTDNQELVNSVKGKKGIKEGNE